MPDKEPLPPPTADQPYIALSIQQPWAWAILRPDLIGDEVRAAARRAGIIKDIENRSWQTKVRGWVYVHAGKTYEQDAWEQIEAELEALGYPATVPGPKDLQLGGIVGRMRIDNCVSCSPSTWFVGDWGFVIGESHPLPFRPFKGALGFFGCPL